MSLVVDREITGGNAPVGNPDMMLIHDANSLTLSVNKVSECALDVPGTVCSTDKTVNDMKKFLKDRNVDQTKFITEKDTLDAMKEETKCTTERCVLKDRSFQSFSDSNAHADSLDNLKPSGPSGSTALLSNTNIDQVLKKLTKHHKNFYHMNFQMIDFAGTSRLAPTELGNIDMVKDVIDRGFKTFAVVMNTDKRTGGGIHWFALFCDFRYSPYSVEYFNSSGNKPVIEIQEWINKTVTHINNHHKTVPIILSGVVHQTSSETECGPYSLYYIWNRLNGKPAVNFQKLAIPDAKMIKFRKMLFA